MSDWQWEYRRELLCRECGERFVDWPGSGGGGRWCSMRCAVLGNAKAPELPVEPVYLMLVACQAIPCSLFTLKVLMKEAQLPALYRYEGGRARRHRVVPASFIRWARDEMVRNRSKRPHRQYVPGYASVGAGR